MSDAPPPGWQVQLWHDIGVPTVLAGGAASLAWLRAILRRRKRRQVAAQIELEGVQRALDGVRQALYLLHRPEAAADDEMQERIAVTRRDVDDVRERLWVATGHESKRDVEAIIREIKRTQPVRPVEDERR